MGGMQATLNHVLAFRKDGEGLPAWAVTLITSLASVSAASGEVATNSVEMSSTPESVPQQLTASFRGNVVLKTAQIDCHH